MRTEKSPLRMACRAWSNSSRSTWPWMAVAEPLTPFFVPLGTACPFLPLVRFRTGLSASGLIAAILRAKKKTPRRTLGAKCRETAHGIGLRGECARKPALPSPIHHYRPSGLPLESLKLQDRERLLGGKVPRAIGRKMALTKQKRPG